MANHTWKHAHVDRMDTAHFAGVLRYVEEKLRSLGAPMPVSFAYPAYVTRPVALFEEYLRVLRDGGYRVVALRDVARYLPADRRAAAAHAAPR